MHITLHLTTGCNLNCNYCYAPPHNRIDMTEQTAKQAIESCSKISPLNTGIIFFGGEPLLKKDLIRSSVEYCKDLRKKNGYQYHFKLTTNGIQLDKDFLNYSVEERILVGLSFDGIKEAHDYHRKTKSDAGSFNILESKLELLLKYQPYANILMVISPETVAYYYESVKYLFNKGAKYIIASLNYAGKWNDEKLKELKKQYQKLSKLYEEMTVKQKKFYFSPFEVKFVSRIKNENGNCDKCHLGMYQLSVSADGFYYPCVQFVGKKEFEIGNVTDGINFKKRNILYKISTGNSVCSNCAVKERCNNSCSCLNIQTTGMINTLSPVLCETERMLIPVVDKLGNKLYDKKYPMFIQKHYNAVYPVLSLIEDSFN